MQMAGIVVTDLIETDLITLTFPIKQIDFYKPSERSCHKINIALNYSDFLKQ